MEGLKLLDHEMTLGSSTGILVEAGHLQVPLLDTLGLPLLSHYLKGGPRQNLLVHVPVKTNKQTDINPRKNYTYHQHFVYCRQVFPFLYSVLVPFANVWFFTF